MAHADVQTKKISFGAWVGALLQLTKPTIVLSFTLTGATAMVMEGSLLQQPLRFIFVLFAIVATAGSANAFNQYLERDMDAQMTRTAKKRPLPQGLVTPQQALRFSVGLGLVAIGILSFAINLLSAFIALATILFYSFFYTLYLKPRTPYNIVIGGAISSAFIPVFISYLKKNKEEAWQIASSFLYIAFFGILLVCALMFIFLPHIL